jgi:hypothetical protein
MENNPGTVVLLRRNGDSRESNQKRIILVFSFVAGPPSFFLPAFRPRKKPTGRNDEHGGPTKVTKLWDYCCNGKTKKDKKETETNQSIRFCAT